MCLPFCLSDENIFPRYFLMLGIYFNKVNYVIIFNIIVFYTHPQYNPYQIFISFKIITFDLSDKM